LFIQNVRLTFVMNLKAIKMKTVIYKECTYQIVRVVSGDININDLKDDEDHVSRYVELVRR
jgi:hypothetical protein